MHSREDRENPLSSDSIERTKKMQTFDIPSSIALPSYEFTESTNISLDSFELIRCIGYGAYGQVWLCEKKDSKVLYAIKSLNKAQLARPSTLNRTVRERELLEVWIIVRHNE